MKLFRSERGATITEVAFVLPVFLLFLMIIMEGGRVLGAWMIITNSTRETARWAVAAEQQTNAFWGTVCSGLTGCQGNCSGLSSSSLVSCIETNLTAAATNYETTLVGNTLDSSALAFTPAPSPSYTDNGAGSVTSVTLTATYTLHTLTPMLQQLVPTFNLYSTSTMRAES